MNDSHKIYETFLSINQNFISDHKVMSKCVVPAAVYFALVMIPLTEDKKLQGIEFSDVNITNAMVVEEDVPTKAVVHLEYDNSKFRFKVMSNVQDKNIIHALGKVSESPSMRGDSLMLNEIRTRCQGIINKNEFYKRYEDSGILYGKYYKTVEEVYTNKFEFLSTIENSNINSENQSFTINPSIIDGVIQSIGAIYRGSPKNIYLPSFIRRVRIYKQPEDLSYCYGVAYCDSSKNPEQLVYDILVCDKDGSLVMDFSHFVLKRFV